MRTKKSTSSVETKKWNRNGENGSRVGFLSREVPKVKVERKFPHDDERKRAMTNDLQRRLRD